MARAEEARSGARDLARRRAQEQTHSGGEGTIKLPDGVKWMDKPKDETYEWDFLPYAISDPRNPDVLAGRAKIGDLSDCRFYWRHGNIGPEEKLVICLKSVGKPCPVCEAIAAMRKNPNADPEEIKSMAAKERVLYNVNADPTGKNMDIRVFDYSYHLFHRQLEEEQKNTDALYDYAQLDKGSTLKVRFRAKHIGRGEPFYEASRIDGIAREAYGEDVLKDVVDLDAALNVMSYQQLEALMNGVAPEDTDAVPAEAPTPRGRSAAAPESAPTTRRAAEAAPAPTGRGRAEAPAADPHRRDPDAEKGRGAAPVEEYAGELDECPAGGKFGVDTDKLKECGTCDVWTDCDDQLRKNAKAKKSEAPASRAKAEEKAPEAPARGAGRARR